MVISREQIIKGLECCSVNKACGGCPYQKMPTLTNCVVFNMHNALSLIKELTEENERLRAENNQWREDWANNQTIWEKNYDSVCDIVTRLETDLKTVKANTVREMQERLKKCLADKPSLFTQQRYIVVEVIDQIAKEMLDEK